MKKQYEFIAITVMLLSACNSGDDKPKTLADTFSFDAATQSREDDINDSIFISGLELLNIDTSQIKSFTFTISAKPGTYSEPIRASYTLDYLKTKNLVNTGDNTVTIPIFGLYSGFTNTINITYQFIDNSTYSFITNITTDTFNDTNNIYNNITTDVTPTTTPEFSFIAMKNRLYPPVIMDIDGNVRWMLPITTSSLSSIFTNNGFYIGDDRGLGIKYYSLFGGNESYSVRGSSTNIQGGFFHHNIDQGKNGFLIELEGSFNGVFKVESYLAEVDHTGLIKKEWDIGKLLRDYMIGEGDDPSNFIRDGVDWFHMNAATYSPDDDTIIVSSRENFVIKIDYDTGNVIWVLGDENKYWFSYPSLQRLSVSLNGGDKPIGQHAVSISRSGQLMFFNNGYNSINQPIGAPTGINLTSSQVEIINIDNQLKHGEVTWQFDDGIYSDVCSSAYENESGNQILINFAAADNRKKAVVMGVDKQKNKLFQYSLSSPQPCATSWNAEIVPLQNIRFQ